MTAARDTDLLKEWTAEQLRQASLAVFTDDAANWLHDTPGPGPATAIDPESGAELHREQVDELDFKGLHTVGGCDISFRTSAGDEGVAVLSVLSFPELQVLTTVSRVVDLSETPYVHSYLSFRESDIYASLLDELQSREPDGRLPQVLFVDGNGRWHPRQAGSAVAVGVKTGLPTIGVAKEFHPLRSTRVQPSDASSTRPMVAGMLHLPADYLASQKSMRRACQSVLRQHGDWLTLPAPVQAQQHPIGPDDPPHFERWGAAVLSSSVRGALNPVFVSSGHRLSLRTCVRLTLACTRGNGKIPEPIRCADLFGGFGERSLGLQAVFERSSRLTLPQSATQVDKK
ncbi:hypothetical protein JCM3774_001722 [Rhodotorula dairenensis]